MNEFILNFQKIVKKYPDNFAIVENGNQKITYKELWNFSQTIAIQLQNKWLQKWEIIAINIDKSIDYIASILAIWSLDAIFMPLSPSLPKDRKDFILEDSQANFIIKKRTPDSSKKRTPKLSEKPSELDKETTLEPAPNLEIQKLKTINPKPFNLQLFNHSTNLPAYLIYTSWSTGMPKGVLVGHNGIVNILQQQTKICNITPNSRALFLLSTNFDASISDIGIILLVGACLYIEDYDANRLILQLPNIIKKRKITYIDIPPSILSILDIDNVGDSLQTMLIWWETANINSIKTWSGKLKLINVYGPTEATICTSMVVCDSYFVEWDIWNPVDGIVYKIDNWESVSEEGIGELLIGGKGLAIWYWNNPKLTQEKFVLINGARFYRTGDLVEKEDGSYIFKWRIDRQVKIRGQLVELEEVENIIKSYRNALNTAVIAIQLWDKKRLLAFIQSKDFIDIDDLKKYIGTRLSSWMIPSEFIFLDKLPLNSNAKIDYHKLKKYKIRQSKSIETKDALAQKIISVWKSILYVDEIGLDDNFFALWGDSLDTIEMITKLSQIGILLPIWVISKEKTIRNIVTWYRKNNNIWDAINVKKLESKSILSDKLKKLIENAKLLEKSKSKNFFITWGSGFLGTRLLKELLISNPNSEFYLLVRWENSNFARNRLLEISSSYGISFSSQELTRIHILCGDISADNLGLSVQDWQYLSSNIWDIIHLAAEVNMVKTYDQLEKTNVEPIKEIIKLSLTNIIKNIHYASTLSVFVASDKNKGIVYEDDDLSDIQVLYGGYAQSKFVVERILQQIPRSISNINIFRYGLLTWDTEKAIFAKHDFLSMFIKGLIDIWSIPDENYDNIFVDITPIDYACAITSSIINSTKFNTFHIANTQGFSLEQILLWLDRKWYQINRVSSNKWLQYIEKIDLSPEQSATIMGLCRLLPDSSEFTRLRSMDLFQGTDISFDMKNLIDLGLGIDIPKADDVLLDLYLERMVDKK